jgi:hypothetical protein
MLLHGIRPGIKAGFFKPDMMVFHKFPAKSLIPVGFRSAEMKVAMGGNAIITQPV